MGNSEAIQGIIHIAPQSTVMVGRAILKPKRYKQDRPDGVTAPDWAEMQTMYIQGASVIKIALRFKIHSSRVRYWLTKRDPHLTQGLNRQRLAQTKRKTKKLKALEKPKAPSLDREVIAQVQQLLAQNIYPRAISIRLNIEISEVYAVIGSQFND